MTTAEIYEAGMSVAFQSFTVALLWIFCVSIFLGFVAWVRGMIG